MKNDTFDQLEIDRLKLQTELDLAKSKQERNRLGQFATPSPLSTSVLQYALRLHTTHQPVRFLDPAIGTGAFYSALLRVFPEQLIEIARGYEIDPHYGKPSQYLWRDQRSEIVIGDFTRTVPPEREADKFNLIICNPPYVRHHHLLATDKKRLQVQAAHSFHTKLSGLSGLYVYFVGIADAWLQKGGIAGWLIPSEFMDVNYGSALRHYLTSQVTLLDVHRFDPMEAQFDDALVSSVMIWFRKHKPNQAHEICFSFGGTLNHPKIHQSIPLDTLRHETKWSGIPIRNVRSTNRTELRIRDLFDIKRGIATGSNEFFILDEEQIHQYKLPTEFLTPILPSPRYLGTDEVKSDIQGNPLLKKPLFLLNCNLSEDQVRKQYPTLWNYLQLGIAQGVHNGYLCRHRALWYAQDKRTPAPFLCTYMGRPSNSHTTNPFRFILNHSRAVAPNVYLNLYPNQRLAAAISKKSELKHQIWKSLQRIPVDKLLAEGRVYGGGLYKIEPKELGNLPVEDIFDWRDEVVTEFPIQIPLL